MSDKTKICCTRYGNVMCSRGSVIPLPPPGSRKTFGSDPNVVNLAVTGAAILGTISGTKESSRPIFPSSCRKPRAVTWVGIIMTARIKVNINFFALKLYAWIALVFSHFFHGWFIVYEVIISSNDFFQNVNVSSSCYYLPVLIDFSVFAWYFPILSFQSGQTPDLCFCFSFLNRFLQPPQRTYLIRLKCWYFEEKVKE